jgi:hypothetical protein
MWSVTRQPETKSSGSELMNRLHCAHVAFLVGVRAQTKSSPLQNRTLFVTSVQCALFDQRSDEIKFGTSTTFVFAILYVGRSPLFRTAALCGRASVVSAGIVVEESILSASDIQP